MTSPANTVTIVVKATDQSAQGFGSAAAGAKKLAAAVDGGPGSAGAALDSVQKKASGLGGVLGNVGTIAGGILAADVLREGAQRVQALVHSSIEAASSLGESQNAVQKTFGDSSAAVLKWGESNAAAAGLSTRAFNQMATPLGAMLKNQGLSMDEVSDHTLKLTQRASDMASVFNTDVTDALTAIQAGLRGESDPLERYGVSLSAVAVDAQAMADTHKKSTAELTNQEKALARLKLIYQQTASTAGDFADTSDGLANAQRIASAEIENAQAKLGSTFLPVMAAAAKMSGNFAEAVGSVPAPLAAVGAALAVASAGVLLFAPRIMATKAALEEMSESSSRVTRGVGQMAVAAGKGAAAITALLIAGQITDAVLGDDLNPQIEALAAGLADIAHGAKVAGEAQRLLGTNLDDLGTALDGANANARGFQMFIEKHTGLSHAFDNTVTVSVEKVEALDDALAQMVSSGNGDDAAKVFEIIAAKATEQGISIEKLKAMFPQYAGAVEVATRKTHGLAAATDEVVKSLDEVEKGFDETFKKIFGYEQAQDAAADAVARLNAQIQQQIEDGVEGAGTLDRNTQAGRDNADMVRDLVQKYEAMMVQAQKTGQSTNGLREQLVNQLVAMGINRAEAERYAASLNGVKAALDGIQSKTVTLRMNVEQNKTYGGGVTEFAHGGIIGAAAGGGPRSNRTLVGEHGPEIADLPPGTMVHSNPDSMAMLAAGGGSGGSLGYVEIGSDGSAFGDWMIRTLAAAIRGKGGDPSVIGLKIRQ